MVSNLQNLTHIFFSIRSLFMTPRHLHSSRGHYAEATYLVDRVIAELLEYDIFRRFRSQSFEMTKQDLAVFLLLGYLYELGL